MHLILVLYNYGILKNKLLLKTTTYVTITQSVQKVENQRVRKAFGTAATSEFNFNEVTAFEFTLVHLLMVIMIVMVDYKELHHFIF